MATVSRDFQRRISFFHNKVCDKPYTVDRPTDVIVYGFFTISSQDTDVQGGSNMTGTDLHVNKPHCAAAVRP